MSINESGPDRIIRLALSAACIAAAFFVAPSLVSLPGIGLLAVGAILGLTGLVGYCPAYDVLGLRTRTVDKSSDA